ncbi:protein kinase [Nonomuraea sp. NPDC049419]|uniref:protein kinase domain-containing protein n=1 Tax=Nonomuraea sp. NPDC049419 TaxID=3155772 RepID=UPI00342F0E75
MPGDPARLGGYWLAARLGAGGRGVVYDAYDDEGRRYAVTVPLGEVGQRYEQVTCPHLARVVAVGSDAGVPYVVSEYVSGPDLRQAVGLHGGPYSGDELVALAAALAAALRSLHAAGLTHSGLNPECVLLADDGPRVIELGLAGARTTDGACPYQAPEVLTGQEAGAAADVFAWGAVVLFAATGDDPFGGDSPGAVMHRLLTVDPDLSCLPEPLAGLVERALAKSPADRPAAAELLIESPVESAVELRPPDAYVRTPSLGEAAEQAYLSLTPRQQEEVPGLLLRLLDGDRPHDEGDVLAPLMAAGLLVRRSIRVPSAETSIGKLVAVSDDKVAPASAALYRAWPRLRGWVADERDGMAVHRRLRRSARQWSEHRRGRGHLLRGDELATALGWAAAKRRHVRLSQLERDFISDSVALAKQRRKLLVPALSAVAAVVAVAVTMTVVTVQGQNDLRGRLLEAGARAVAARAEALRTSDPRAAMRLSVAAWRMSPIFEARAALQSSLVQPELGVFTDPRADGRARYLLRGDELVRWDAGAVTVYDVTGGREVASYPLPPGSIGLSDDGRFAEGASGPVEVATGQAPADGVFTISRGNRTRVYRGTRVLFDVIDRKVALSPDGTRGALSGLDGRVELWELAPRRVRTGVVKVEPLTGSVAAAPALAFSPDGGTLAVAGRDGVTLVGAGARRTGAPETLATHHPDLPTPTTPPSPGPGLLALPSPLPSAPADPSPAQPSPAQPFTAGIPASPGTNGSPPSPGVAAAPASPGTAAAPASPGATGAPATPGSGPSRSAETFGFAPSPRASALPSRAGTSGRPQAASPSPSRTPDPRATAGPSTADPAPTKTPTPTKTPALTETPAPKDGRDAEAAPGTPSAPDARAARDAEAAVVRDGRVGADPDAGRDSGSARSAKAEVARVVAQAVRAKRVRVKSGDPGSGAERAWGVEVVDGLEVTPATAAGPLVFSPDGRLLALPGDGEVRVWNVAERRLAGSYPLKDPGRELAFSADGRTLRYLSGIGSVVSLDVSGLPAPAGEGQVAAFSGNGRVAAKEVGDAIELTDAESRRTLGRIAAAGDLAFDATGRLLAVAGDPVTVWEVASGRQVTSIEAGGDVPAVALSPDGGTLATARGPLLETWDVRSGRRIKAYESVGDLALAFSPDGMTLAAGMRLLDLRTGQVTPLDLAARAGEGAAATALAFSPDGDRLAFGLEGGRVLLWGVHERAPIGTIRTGSGPVDEVRFSPDGGLMAIDAGRTSLWDVSTLREVGQAGSWAAGPAFSQDGTRLRGVALDGSVREFPVDPALTAQAVCERAGGSLTREEWARLIPEADYREVC